MLSPELMLQLAHRKASAYRHDADGVGGHQYHFKPHTLIDFAQAIADAAMNTHREAARADTEKSEANLGSEQPAGRWQWIDRGPVWVDKTQQPSAVAAPDAWREVMAEMADDIECEAKNTYVSREQYPSEMRKFKASVAIVERARALLDEHAAGSVLAREELSSGNVPDAAVAAIQFALLQGLECETFLRLWNEGEFEVIRTEWPDCPPAVFIGADPLMPSQETPAEGASASTLMDDLDTVLAHDLTPSLDRIHVLIEGEYYSATFLLKRVREAVFSAQRAQLGKGGVR